MIAFMEGVFILFILYRSASFQVKIRNISYLMSLNIVS
jgi:hypothetical protein